ncbi:MAG: dihydrodipicolinate reductase [Candidatus Dormibacteraceae bacterium]
MRSESTDSPITVACVGLGPIGLEVARAATGDHRFRVSYAVDPAPSLAGQSLGQLLDTERHDADGPTILGSIEDLPRPSGPGVVFLCTGSRLAGIGPQLQQLVDRGWNVVSTCEELVHAVPANRELWDHLDAVARQAGVRVLGVGINPGFVMDLLPAVLALPCLERRTVRIVRRVDASRRRRPLQAKVGVGMTEQEFRTRAESNQIGHVGLRESASLLAASLGWELETIDDELEPVLDSRNQVIGLRQTLRASDRVGRGLSLELEMYLGAAKEADEITIDADPPVHCIISGGYQGDRATVGMVLNVAPLLLHAAPGLRTVFELALAAPRKLRRPSPVSEPHTR